MKQFDKLNNIVKKLRSPEGCPWDRKQTHISLLPYLLEECYEVFDTVIKEDWKHLKEELGDLLLQIMLHSEIESENNNFCIEDVLNDLSEKLVRRHPHVFGDKNVSTANEVVILWEDIKQKEKKDLEFESILDKIPKTFHPLLKCYKYQKEAAKAGFDWDNYKDVLKKIQEETSELLEAIEQNNIKNIEHEIGDIIFALTNLGKFFDIRADVALAKANIRFYNRFKFVEKKVSETNKKFSDFTIKELDQFWEMAKKELKDNIYE